MDLYSAFIVVPHTHGAQVRITQCYLQITPYLPIPRKSSPDGPSPDWGCGHLIAAYYSFYLSWKDERLSRPGWLTYRRRFTHISCHPLAAGRAQDSESSPVKDWRSTTVPPAIYPWHCQETHKLMLSKTDYGGELSLCAAEKQITCCCCVISIKQFGSDIQS